jgi:glycosyltransferase involved in cell wall biosynthesis
VVEVMAVGVPVVASPSAVHGMELEDGIGILLGDDEAGLADLVIRLLSEPSFATRQSRLAREQVERLFSSDDTYGRLTQELRDWLIARKRKSSFAHSNTA